MSSPEKVLNQVQDLINRSNARTGRIDTDLTTAVDALIAGYSKECTHANSYEGNYRNNDDDNGHSFNTICRDCGEILATHEENHVDDNGDGICDLCGGCIHEHETVYISNGNGTHIRRTYCTKCGYVDYEEVVACTEDDPIITDNGNGTHTIVFKCNRCGGTMETVTEACEDTDGDGKCDVCGSNVGCSHSSASGTVVVNGDGTHTTKMVCASCQQILSQTTTACSDANGDGKCDVCGNDMPTGEPVGKTFYDKGELSGRSGYMFSAKNGELAATSYNSCVAVGAKQSSGRNPLGIPIPKGATKLTLTFDDGGTNHVDFLFIDGTPEQVTGYNEDYDADVVDGVCTFEGTGADYVVFNCYGSWDSSIQKSNVGKLATLLFE